MNTTFDRIALAQVLRERSVPRGQKYLKAWVSFNAFYNTETDHIERNRVINSIKNNISEADAKLVLTALNSTISYFSKLPPSNTQLDSADYRFRNRSTNDLVIVNNPNYSAIERLAYLVSVLYQIRCNLIHGDKNPDSLRDRQLVSHSLDALDKILPLLY